jgi:GH25 family lysozyme M1 (1,4-beta-N-acetylmuramidase)
MWQGDVDWPAVGDMPTRFVIMRATRGRDYVDPKYAEYLAGASANGLVVGAYHRAKVDLTANDARAEANHFVDVAQIDAGDVLPALDIEEHNGLGVDQLREWVRTWLARVYARTGVRALIYASPHFWRTYLGDATWFADHGYPLWIAHWGVASPDVPANDWGGHGWSFWQWTSTGHVDGIVPAVDRDRFRSSSLLRGRIASLVIDPPAGGAITGPRIACGGVSTTCERLANADVVITLTAAPDPGATLIGWTGACAAAGVDPTCDVTALGAKTVSAVFGYPLHVGRAGSGGGTVTSSPGGIDCGGSCAAAFPVGSDVELTASPDSASVFTGWSGACTGAAPVCTVAVSEPTDVVATFQSVVSVEQDGAGAAFAWGRRSHRSAIGGSYRWERRAGASVTFAFTGNALTVFTVSGPAFGRGRISVDGAPVATFDGYAPAFTTGVKRRLDGLGPGDHVVSVEVLGTRRPAASGTRVGVDAVRWGGITRPNPTPTESAWSTVADAAASGGTYAISDAAGAFARLRFTGTGLSVRVRRGPGMGRAAVWVDGAFERVVDLYAPAPGFARITLVSGLPDGSHAARLVVLGARRAEATGSVIAVDRWLVA